MAGVLIRRGETQSHGAEKACDNGGREGSDAAVSHRGTTGDWRRGGGSCPRAFPPRPCTGCGSLTSSTTRGPTCQGSLPVCASPWYFVTAPHRSPPRPWSPQSVALSLGLRKGQLQAGEPSRPEIHHGRESLELISKLASNV